VFFFGANLETDAFYVAFRIPNLFRRLLAEGTLSTTIVPFFTELHLSNNNNFFKKIRNDIFTIIFVILFFTTLIFYFFSKQIVFLFAFGFDQQTNEIASQLLRNMSPFLFLISLSALNMGLLNSIKKFNAPAFSPVMLNLGIILTLIISYVFFSIDIFLLSYAVLFGALLQYVFQLPFVLKNNLGYFFNYKNVINERTTTIIVVLIPQIFGLAIYNLNILINTQFASFMEKGSVTYLYLAERLLEFPLGIFAVSIATTTLPVFANLHLGNKLKEFGQLINNRIKFLLFLSMPCAVAFIFLGTTICSILYSRGEFTNSDAILTSKALFAYSIGLVFVAGIRVVTVAFYAMKDTKTPVRLAGINLLINCFLCYFLGFFLNLGFFGLALASSISAIILFLLLIIKLKEHLNEINLLDITKYLFIVLVVSIFSIMFSSWIIDFVMKDYLDSRSSISFILIVSLSILTYLSLAKIAGLKELRMIFK
jgi:putative peptidoglycan lipid II flippase